MKFRATDCGADIRAVPDTEGMERYGGVVPAIVGAWDRYLRGSASYGAVAVKLCSERGMICRGAMSQCVT